MQCVYIMGYYPAIKKNEISWAVVAHTFNSSTWEAEAGRFLSSRPAWSTARATQRNPVSTKKKKKKKKNQRKKKKERERKEGRKKARKEERKEEEKN
jgi:hypothetical protein